MAVMKSADLVSKVKSVAKTKKTLYVMGCFGAPMTTDNKKRYTANHSYNMTSDRKAMINSATADTFGFDCVNLIKGILWGWAGDKTKEYGGAKYNTNGVPDINADMMIKECSGVSTNFSNIVPGEAVWMAGHIGVYIGDGLAVECTPKWNNCVQITAVGNIGKKTGYHTRTWTKHGKLPYVSYSTGTTGGSTSGKKKSVATVAKEVVDGKWGNGDERKKKLEAAGYDYAKVQAEVNKLISGKDIVKVAKEVIEGKWGNGAERKKKLEAAGYDYNKVQAEVNKLLG